jgi:DNA-binding IclR family transcriptional regulator
MGANIKLKPKLIQSIDRALQILESFSNEEKELGVTEIANRLDLHKSTVHGILTTLEYRGYIKKNVKTGKYQLGLKLLELGNLVHDSMDLISLAKPYLQELVNKHQETVHLVVYDRGEVIYIDKIEGKGAIKIMSRIGKRNPVHCTGVGKCLLAFREDHEIEMILKQDLKKYTVNTITDSEKLKEQILEIRKNGYAFDMEEIELGLRCIAAPIRDHRRKVVAAISLSGPSMRMDQERMQNLVTDVKKAADMISRNLGYIDMHF